MRERPARAFVQMADERNISDVIGPSNPRLRSAPRTNVHLAGPQLTRHQHDVPRRERALASSAPARSVASGSRGELGPRHAGARAGRGWSRAAAAPEGERPGVDARVRQRGAGGGVAVACGPAGIGVAWAVDGGAGIAVATGAARRRSGRSPAARARGRTVVVLSGRRPARRPRRARARSRWRR